MTTATSFIVLVGIDGCGKTTLGGELLRRNSVSATISWKDFFDGRIQIPGVASDLHLAHVLPQLVPEARAALILYLVTMEYSSTRRPRNSPRPILIDSYWYKFAAKESEFGVVPGWFFDAVQALPIPDKVIFLDTPADVAHERKGDLTSYEGGPGRCSFVAFQERVRSSMLAWTEDLDRDVLDGRKSVEELTDDVEMILLRRARE